MNNVCKLLLSTFYSGLKHDTIFSHVCTYVYLPDLLHYGWVSRLQTKDINLRHQGQFLKPDSQTWTNCSYMINKKKSFQFPQKYSKKALNDHFVSQWKQNTLTSLFLNSFGSAKRSSEHLRTFSATFWSPWKIVGSLWNVFWNPGHNREKISCIWLRKSWQVYVCDKAKVVKAPCYIQIFRHKSGFFFRSRRFRTQKWNSVESKNMKHYFLGF